MFSREFLMRSDVIQADADDSRAGFLEREDIVTEVARLGRAARRHVLGVKIQHQPLAGVVRETVPRAFLVLKFECGRRRSDLRGRSHSAGVYETKHHCEQEYGLSNRRRAHGGLRRLLRGAHLRRPRHARPLNASNPATV